jgi:ABC-type nitrate/sulfonate/bicarbonate transport system permease component
VKERPWLLSGLIYALVVLAWQGLAMANPQPGSLWPSPFTVAGTIWEDRGIFLANAGVTLLEAALGFGGGVLLAVVLSALSMLYPPVGDGLYRLSLILYSLPLIAVAPLLVVWVGPGFLTKVIIALLASFFPILVNTTQSVRTTDPKPIELLSAWGASAGQILWRVRIPYALPALVASFKIAAPAAIVGAMLAEWVGAERGLGLMILFSMFNLQVPRLWAALIVASAVSFMAYYAFELLGRRLFPWHPSTRGFEGA